MQHWTEVGIRTSLNMRLSPKTSNFAVFNHSRSPAKRVRKPGSEELRPLCFVPEKSPATSLSTAIKLLLDQNA